jgi:murein L,D-transpeptidase YafK
VRLSAYLAAGAALAHVAAAAVHPRQDDQEGGAGAVSKLVPLAVPSLAAERHRRLAEKGMAAGRAVMIRIFKAESQLELWMEKGEQFELFARYPICSWSGRLGPKEHEGDHQAPEGLYSIGLEQIHRHGRRPRSLDLGFPNAFDKANARTGSTILLHGGCTSVGCYAMTDPVMEEIYALSEKALLEGQERIPVQVFPFRMTEANLSAYAQSVWFPFWRNLREAYDAFEATHVPPKVGVCGKRYRVVPEGALGPEGGDFGGGAACDIEDANLTPVALAQGETPKDTTPIAVKPHHHVLAQHRARVNRSVLRHAKRAAGVARLKGHTRS